MFFVILQKIHPMEFSSLSSSHSVDRTFAKRLDKRGTELEEYYISLYGKNSRVDEHLKQLFDIMVSSHNERKETLKILDLKREQNPSWFQSQDKIAIMLYLDLFATNLLQFKEKVEYFVELGITFIHLMPLFKTPKSKNDGGYAVSSYMEVHEDLGTMNDLEEVIDIYRENQISICLDFVLNHTSDEHDWALSALEGDSEHQNLYCMYDTIDYPQEYASTTPEVFPNTAPGHFTYLEKIDKYVMTTFFEYQWDLNYKNPKVLNQICKLLLFLANRGVEIFRLDAIPYIWKELGTTSRNLPQVHTIVRLLRQVVEVVAPSVLFLGEAIVAPKDIMPYFGGKNADECHLMYNASLMVLIWNSLATKKVDVMRNTLEKYPQIPSNTAWLNYARSHDDIGWGFDEGVLENHHLDPTLHKQFIVNFYHGNYDFSFARGELYEFNNQTLDARTCGTLASLAGLEEAINNQNEYAMELALKRILLIHSFFISFPGIPLIYSGDEIAQLNDYSYKEDPRKSHDSRWLHRPNFDWERASRRDDLGSAPGFVFQRIRRMIQTRKNQEIFRSDIQFRTFATGNSSVFGYFKRTKKDHLMILHNFSENQQILETDYLKPGYFGGKMRDLLQGKEIDLKNDSLIIGPYEFLWLYSPQ